MRLTDKIRVALLGCCLLAPAMTAAATVDLRQDGWAFGGPLTLSFTGEDQDLDGAIEQSELVDFEAIFNLSTGQQTSWSLADIQPDGFLFSDPGNFLFFATNAEYSLVDAGFEGEALASVFDKFLFPVDETEAAPQVVPEPAGMALLGLASMVAAAWSRSRQRNS